MVVLKIEWMDQRITASNLYLPAQWLTGSGTHRNLLTSIPPLIPLSWPQPALHRRVFFFLLETTRSFETDPLLIYLSCRQGGDWYRDLGKGSRGFSCVSKARYCWEWLQRDSALPWFPPSVLHPLSFSLKLHIQYSKGVPCAVTKAISRDYESLAWIFKSWFGMINA